MWYTFYRKTNERIAMDEKSILEVAFEWICECGAYERLKKQCENYTTDISVRYNMPEIFSCEGSNCI